MIQSGWSVFFMPCSRYTPFAPHTSTWAVKLSALRRFAPTPRISGTPTDCWSPALYVYMCVQMFSLTSIAANLTDCSCTDRFSMDVATFAANYRQAFPGAADEEIKAAYQEERQRQERQQERQERQQEQERQHERAAHERAAQRQHEKELAQLEQQQKKRKVEFLCRFCFASFNTRDELTRHEETDHQRLGKCCFVVLRRLVICIIFASLCLRVRSTHRICFTPVTFETQTSSTRIRATKTAATPTLPS